MCYIQDLFYDMQHYAVLVSPFKNKKIENFQNCKVMLAEIVMNG
jgi:hypothetical protein